MEVSISNTSLNTFNQSIDEIVKLYFKGHSMEDTLKITKGAVTTTSEHYIRKQRANVTFRILEKRKKRKQDKREIKIDLYNNKMLASIKENING